MSDYTIEIEKDQAATPARCTAPAAGCFGQLHATEAYGGTPRRSADDVAHDWESVAQRFYLMGYRDGGKAI
ncbi:hypothetical protein [Sphingobium boeckii]|uniref:Isochorismate synthase EntC n=1 Tax=Sphingobium boeckii TaxID=1082345 RepID=A0A7W9AGL3_9SPHN|nr:hypothetical protein [Sphingobium boeckii]MBB5685121.1 isochorismate synthase EntC [Sphingobium boeckii]